MTTRHAIQVHVGRDPAPPLRVVRAAIVEELSSRTRAEVFFTLDPLDPRRADGAWPASWLGAPAALELSGPVEGVTTSRRLTLTVARVALAAVEGDAELYVVELVDPMAPLALGLGTRKLVDARAEDVAARILGEHGIAARIEVRTPSATRPWVIQYRESPLAFVERVLERDGLHYAHDEDGTVVIRDDSTTAPVARGGLPFSLAEGQGALGRDDAAIHRVRRGHRVAPGRVVLLDRDWKKPQALLRGEGRGARDQDLEVFVHGGHGRDEGTLKRLADRRVEALRALADDARLDGDVHDVAPGTRLRVPPMVAGDLGADEVLVVRCEHTVVAGSIDAAADEPASYHVAMRAIPATVPFRVPPRTPLPRLGGHHTAFVRGPAGEEIHTDEHGRLRVQMHWDREARGDDGDSRWIRLAQETSSSMVIARTSWEVHVGYLGGDPERPIGLGRAIGGKAPPIYDQPAGKTRMTIRTPSSPATGGYNEIGMEDKAGAQLLQIRAERDLDTVTKKDSDEIVGRDQTVEVEKQRKLEVQGDLRVEIGGDDTFRTEKGLEHAVDGSLAETIGRSESVDVGAASSTTVARADAEKVGTARISLVGSIQKPDFKAMARSALEGLVPEPIRRLRATAQSLSSGGGRDLVSGLFRGGVDAAADRLVGGQGGQAALGALGTSVRDGLRGALGLPAGGAGGGLLPSIDDLRQTFSAESLAAGFRAQLPGALSQATGGLSDLFRADTNQATFGWDQADKLIDLLAKGGILRGATSSIRRLVGGAMIEAAVGPIAWASSAVWMETIGGIKLTRAAFDVKQVVTGVMKVTVGGLVTRKAPLATLETTGAVTVTVAGPTTLHALESVALRGVKGLTLEVAEELKLSAGDGKTVATFTPDTIAVTAETLNVIKAELIQISGKNLEVAGG